MNQVSPEQLFMVIGEQAVQIRFMREQAVELQKEITRLKPAEVKDVEQENN